MRVLQIIDSLNVGGAERMAVTIANRLVDRIEFSAICSTRERGALEKTIDSEVRHMHLDRKKKIDIKALRKLSRFIKEHRIEVLHAHSSSFFTATLMKMRHPKLGLIWHDHHGSRVHKSKPKKALAFFSKYFDQVITANQALADWSNQHLTLKEQAQYFANFVSCPAIDFNQYANRKKQIICVGNVKPIKGQLDLVSAFAKAVQKYPDWSLLLAGGIQDQEYSRDIKALINQENLNENVKLLGSIDDVSSVLLECQVGVIASTVEGLPVALLEYGAAGLAVIGTDVGQVATVIETNGLVIEPNNINSLTTTIIELISSQGQREKSAIDFNRRIVENYSATAQIPVLLNLYKKL